MFDLEYEAILKSGQLKQTFKELRRELIRLTSELAATKAELADVRAGQAQRQRLVPRQPEAPRRPVLTPLREEQPQQAAPAPPPEPAPTEEKGEAPADDTVARFSLLELD